MKDFKTYDEQVELLKTRGLTINDKEFAIKKLEEGNYYNIINGYKDLFIIPNTDNFISGSTFEEIYSLYNFDRNLRTTLFKYILNVENTLRSLVAYNFSQRYGNDNYLKLDNFETLRGSGCTEEKYQERIVHIQKLLTNLQKDISGAITKKEYIKHYILNYGFIPLWVVVNCITLGRLGQFYRLMSQPVRVAVAQHWEIEDEDLSQYIKTLSYYRNLCAHDERIYNTKSAADIPNTDYHSILSIPMNNGRYQKGKRDLFSLVIVLKILLPNDEFINMCDEINELMNQLKIQITHISCQDIFDKMGFPSNWYDIKTA